MTQGQSSVHTNITDPEYPNLKNVGGGGVPYSGITSVSAICGAEGIQAESLLAVFSPALFFFYKGIFSCSLFIFPK